MTKKEVKAEIRRVKHSIRFLLKNESSLIRRIGEEGFQAQLDFALKTLKEWMTKLEEFKD